MAGGHAVESGPETRLAVPTRLVRPAGRLIERGEPLGCGAQRRGHVVRGRPEGPTSAPPG